MNLWLKCLLEKFFFKHRKQAVLKTAIAFRNIEDVEIEESRKEYIFVNENISIIM